MAKQMKYKIQNIIIKVQGMINYLQTLKMKKTTKNKTFYF